MEIIHHKAEAYAEKFTSLENTFLEQIHARTLQNHPQAKMMSSLTQGRILALLSRLKRPKYILEIGTFTGFSTLCLAEGLSEDGIIHTIEIREQDADTAEKNFNLSPFAKKINLHRGNALDIIPKLDIPWDLVFIDADKTGYIKYYDMVLPRLRKDGLIIADNVLFHGEVLEEKITGKNANAIHAFNEYVFNDKSTQQVLGTIRDGLLLIQKK
ncbi:MAG: O-methyltransferase [Bacteroidetes bacterium]|nr:O-methyltransferase [Bacteroidota bacterium]